MVTRITKHIVKSTDSNISAVVAPYVSWSALFPVPTCSSTTIKYYQPKVRILPTVSITFKFSNYLLFRSVE